MQVIGEMSHDELCDSMHSKMVHDDAHFEEDQLFAISLASRLEVQHIQ